MLIRVTALIVISSFVSYWLWPLERIYIYGIVLGVALLIFGLPLLKPFPKKPSDPPHPRRRNNVVQLDEFRKKKEAEKQQKQTSGRVKK